MNNDSRLLAKAGVILLTVSLLNGFLIHFMPQERQALSAHLVGLIGSSLLIAMGCLWPHLNQKSQMSRTGAFLAVYGFCMGWLINFLAAVTGNFGVFPLSVGVSQGNPLGDITVSAGLISVALSLLALCGIVFRGLGRSDGSR